MPRLFWKCTAVCSVLGVEIAVAQHASTRVSARNRYERVIVVERLRGAAGTFADPHAPAAPWQVDPTVRTGILAYFSQPSDDGRFLLVEYVARDRAALQPVLSDPNVVAAFIDKC